MLGLPPSPFLRGVKKRVSVSLSSFSLSSPRSSSEPEEGVIVQWATWLMSCIWTQAIIITIFFAWSLFAMAQDLSSKGASPLEIVSFFGMVLFLTLGFPWLQYFAFQIIAGDSFIVPEETRKRKNFKKSHHVPLLSHYNMFETGAQAVVHIYCGMLLGRVDMIITPMAYSAYDWIICIIQAWGMLFVADFFNYFFHRYAHTNRWLYHTMHALHHQDMEPEHSVYTLFYVHPIEMFLSNVCFLSGTFMWHTDLFTITIYGFISSCYVGAGHSGLLFGKRMDWFLDSSFHELHHSRMMVNFSEHFTIMDRVMGTYKEMPDKAKQERREHVELDRIVKKHKQQIQAQNGGKPVKQARSASMCF